MGANILITGAAGYIGGSIVADFLASGNPAFSTETVHASARSEEQVDALKKLGIKVIHSDLGDEAAVVESVLRHNISVVIHTASSINVGLALPLITALGKQREVSGKQTYFIHTSGLSAFYGKTGWPDEVNHDTHAVFETEKRLADSFPIRKTDVVVTEYAKEVGVTSYIVVPSLVYGKGTGPWNQLSVNIPIYTNALIAKKALYRFPENLKVSGVHISDLTSLYRIMVEKIYRGETIQSGTEGYYFALAHDLYWWQYLDSLAANLKDRGLIEDTRPHTWPNDEEAAQALGVPPAFVGVMWNSGGDFKASTDKRIGWKPQWNEKRCLENVGDDVDAIVELGKAKSSLVDSLFKAAQG